MNDVGLAPFNAIVLIVSVPEPVFLTVTVWAAVVVPTAVEAKLKLPGETDTVGVGEAAVDSVRTADAVGRDTHQVLDINHP